MMDILAFINIVFIVLTIIGFCYLYKEKMDKKSTALQVIDMMQGATFTFTNKDGTTQVRVDGYAPPSGKKD
jgi:uncharacterized protein YxeA